MLVSYAGNTITTDAIGNTLWDGLFSYTWQHGRQLASATKTGTTVTYKYNADGIRTSKTVNGILHTYDLSGTSIVRECIYNSTGTYVAIELRYYYDAKGAPTAMRVFKKANANATPQEFVCYFATNLQGDVVALYDEDGNRISSYTYDAWGNNIYKTSAATPDISAADAQWLMNLNPFRYRGYYYDTDTGLYYLQSRYYNPIWGRFINADSHINANGDLIGFNLYAYCSNNPIMNVDPTGEWSWEAFAGSLIIGACFVGLAVIFTASIVATAGASAAIVGAAAIGGMTSVILSSVAIAADKEESEGLTLHDVINVATDATIGTLAGAFGGIKFDKAAWKGAQIAAKYVVAPVISVISNASDEEKNYDYLSKELFTELFPTILVDIISSQFK